MPRNRSRGIINNFEFPPEFLKSLQLPDQVDTLQRSPQLPTYLCFGDISQYTKHSGKFSGLSSVSDFDNISDFEIASFGRSSTSSISWNDDFDVEGTEHVQNELELLDKIIQGKESIPPHYNRDEYEQWMKLFPGLSVFEKAKNTTQQNPDSSLVPCEKTFSGVKFAGIEDTVHKNSMKQSNSKLTTGLRHCNKIANHTPRDKHTKRFDSILRISPVLLQEPINRSFYLDTKRQSSQSVFKSAKSASKWMREERPEYSLLPHLPESAKSRPNKTVNIQITNSSKLRMSSNKEAATSKNYVSLPPINTITVPCETHCRSISATPRKVCNEQSVVSAHIDSLKRRRKVAPNNIDSLQNLLNYQT